MRLIFMGTSEFAVPTFLKLVSSQEHEIVAVYTKEPKQAKRGQKLQVSPIHDLALKYNLPVLIPKSFCEDDVIKQFQNFKADVAIVISYGLLLPKRLLEGVKYGCFNLHPSALPLWRGAAPIQRTIMGGEVSTAVCVIKMDEGLDSGDIAKEEFIELLGNETFESLSKNTSNIGAKLIYELLQDLENGQILLKKQKHQSATYAKKIDKIECKIDWNCYGAEIINKIRALSGSIGAFFLYDQEKIKILEAEFVNQNLHSPEFKNQVEVGLVIDKNFGISCKNGIIFPKILQRQGKKAMLITEFLNGFKPEIGKILGKFL